MTTARFIFWHHAPDILHAPYITALARRFPRGAVHCAFAGPLSEHRRALGWQTPDLENCSVNMLKEGRADEVLRVCGPDTVHIFNGVLMSPSIGHWFNYFRTRGARVFLTSEWRDWRSVKGVLRRLDSVLHERRWRRGLSGVFAMGELGERWFQMCGYEPHRIFPFCYVVNSDGLAPNYRLNDEVALIFVGSLVKRKRLDLLLSALAQRQNRSWHLVVVGDGPERQALESFASRLRLTDRVSFVGVLDNRAGREQIAAADLLVLPSQEDGWGAVVNEALMAGTPAICSDACGAADLLRSQTRGSVFRCGDAAHLARRIVDFMSEVDSFRASRQATRNWAHVLSGDSVAGYIVDCVDWAIRPVGSKPIAPWRRDHTGSI